jgi:hypothetical protein
VCAALFVHVWLFTSERDDVESLGLRGQELATVHCHTSPQTVHLYRITTLLVSGVHSGTCSLFPKGLHMLSSAMHATVATILLADAMLRAAD